MLLQDMLCYVNYWLRNIPKTSTASAPTHLQSLQNTKELQRQYVRNEGKYPGEERERERCAYGLTGSIDEYANSI